MKALFYAPLLHVDRIENSLANDLLEVWGHNLGRCERPFRTESFALFQYEKPIALAMSVSIVHGPVAGYSVKDVVELGRLASCEKWANRIMIRAWREICAPLYAGWNIKAAVSYSHNSYHGGDTYRTDGWEKVSDNCGSDGRGGNWGRRGQGYANPAIHGKKTLWLWRYAP